MFGNNYNNGANNNRSNNMNPNEFRNELNQYGRNQRAMKYMPGFLVLKIVSVAFRNIFVIIRDFWVTLLWIAVFWFGVNSDIPAFGGLVVIVGLAMMIAGFLGPQFGEKYEWMSQFQKYAPIIADVGRRGRVIAELRKREEAYRFFEHAGIMPAERLMEMNADLALVDYGETVKLTVPRGLPGVRAESIIQSSRDFQSIHNAVRTVSQPLSHGGVELTFFRNDPMDISYPTEKPLKVEPKKLAISCAMNAFGQLRSIVLAGAAGMMVGGEPGSGKSESITTAILSLIIGEDTVTRIIDGKGGTEWLAYANVADDYVRGDEDIIPVYNVVKKQFDIMNDRLKNLENTLGSSNFHNVSPADRRKAGVLLELLIIDECQGLFETRKAATKDEKMMLGEIERMCTALVKRGRSAGMFTIFMTQKPTADAIPSAISSNCGLRICFSVNTPAAEISVLGSIPVNSDVTSATQIPRSRPGVAIMATDTGQFEEVRFFYMDEQVKKQILIDAGKKKQLARAA